MSPEQPTFNQLNEQFDAGHRDNMTMLVKGEDGTISTGNFTGKMHAESGRFQVETPTADGTKEFKLLPKEAMSDEQQAELANELAATREESEILVEAPESKEVGPQVSEEVREEIGEAALDAFSISESDVVEEAPEESEASEDTPEAKNDLPEDVQELVGTFLRRGGLEVDELLASTSGEVGLLDELKNTMNTLRYGDVGNKQQYVQHQMEMVGQLSGAFQRDTGSELGMAVSRFHGELDEAAQAIKKDQEASEELLAKARLLLNTTDEIEINARSLNGINDDLAAEARSLMRTFEDLQNDSWGAEMYVSLIGQKLQTIEDSLLSRRTRLMRIQEELPALQRATQQ